MIPLTIAWTNLRRTMRDRTNAFFFVLFPLLMILVLGLAFGGEFTPRVAVVVPHHTPLATALRAGLERADGIEVQRMEDRAEAVAAVERGRVTAAVLVPATYDETLARGGQASVEYMSRADRAAQQVGMIVRAAVDRQSSRLRVARVYQERLGDDPTASVQRADAVAASVAEVSVTTTTTGTARFPVDLGRFDTGASSQLLLFIFITSMTTASALIETRRLGIARRMLATPVRVRSIVAGEALGRIAVATAQGLIIMVGAALIFGVSWGSPPAAALLMLLFATVAGGAGMLLGSVSRNNQQAVAVGLLLGLGLSALGGSMMPLEFFSPTMLTVAHVTPHAWAADGYATLVRHDGSLGDIVPYLGVLAVYAAVLFALASWTLRRRIVNAH